MAAKKPAGVWVQLVAPTSELEPAPQSLQLALPPLLLYLPASHEVQASTVPSEYCPAAQLLHEPLQEVAYVPA